MIRQRGFSAYQIGKQVIDIPVPVHGLIQGLQRQLHTLGGFVIQDFPGRPQKHQQPGTRFAGAHQGQIHFFRHSCAFLPTQSQQPIGRHHLHGNPNAHQSCLRLSRSTL